MNRVRVKDMHDGFMRVVACGLQRYGGKPLLENAACQEGDGFAALLLGRIPRAALA